jgi:flagellar biosynthetic protein FlhB
MAEHENADKESRSEQASDKKLDDAKREGNVAIGRELGVAAIIGSIWVSMLVWAGSATAELREVLARILASSGDIRLVVAADLITVMQQLAAASAQVLGPILALIIVMSFAAYAVQIPIRIVGKHVRPTVSRVSLSAGLKRIYGPQGLLEFAKSLTKLVLGFVIACGLWFFAYPHLISAAQRDNGTIGSQLLAHGTVITLTVLVLAGVIAMADVALARFRWRRSLRMTRDEVKREQKDNQGDPIVKARRFSVARARIRRRMISNVPRATLVIANPTHFAVALRYVRGEQAAPLVLAKGVDHLAIRIRTMAEELDIPVVENRELARALYNDVEIDQLIPPAYYKAIAAIIHYLMSRGRRGVRSQAPDKRF